MSVDWAELIICKGIVEEFLDYEDINYETIEKDYTDYLGEPAHVTTFVFILPTAIKKNILALIGVYDNREVMITANLRDDITEDECDGLLETVNTFNGQLRRVKFVINDRNCISAESTVYLPEDDEAAFSVVQNMYARYLEGVEEYLPKLLKSIK
jgi:hypothetical protein